MMKIKLLTYTFIFLAAQLLHAQNFVPDPDFGSNGRVSTYFAEEAAIKSVFLQPDGKILACGHLFDPEGIMQNTYFITLSRYNASGSPDASFGENGVVITTLKSDIGNYGAECALQPDGKILLADVSLQGANPELLRYNNDGTPDLSFGNNGLAIFESGVVDSESLSISLQSDGKILYSCTTGNDMAVYRFSADGTTDTTFGSSGTVTVNFGTDSNPNAATYEIPNTIRVLDDGKILVAGVFFNTSGDNGDFALIKLNADGSLDTTFGTNGKVRTDFGGTEEAVVITIQPDNKIIVTGRYWYDDDQSLKIPVSRYLPDGTPDNDFGVAGKVLADYNGATKYTNAAQLLPDGKLLVVSSVSDYDTYYNLSLLKLNTDGSNDTDFGDNGFLNITNGSLWEAPYAAVLQPDGKIVVGGAVFNQETEEEGFEVIRLQDVELGIKLADANQIGVAPNPFNDSITINFNLAKPMVISLELLDINGRKVLDLISNKPFGQGANSEKLQMPENLSKGIYLLKVSTDKTQSIIKLLK